MAEHIVPRRTYYIIYFILLIGTLVTWWVAYYDLGTLNTITALAIAVFKAVLVVLFFMHVKYGSRLTKLIAGVAFFFLAILLSLTMADYLSRGWFTAPNGSTAAGAIVSLSPKPQPVPPAEPAQNISPK